MAGLLKIFGFVCLNPYSLTKLH